MSTSPRHAQRPLIRIVEVGDGRGRLRTALAESVRTMTHALRIRGSLDQLISINILQISNAVGVAERQGISAFAGTKEQKWPRLAHQRGIRFRYALEHPDVERASNYVDSSWPSFSGTIHDATIAPSLTRYTVAIQETVNERPERRRR